MRRMRRKTPTGRGALALAVATGAAVAGPLAMTSSCSKSSSGHPADAGSDVTVLVAGVCGDGVLNLGEQCDPGPGGGAGCNKDCTYVCIPDTLNGNAFCDDHNPCNGAEICVGDNDAGIPSHSCGKGTPPGDGTPCGNGKTCKNQVCPGAAVCGNGVVDTGEECDDGSNNGTGECTTSCKWTCVSSDPTRNCAAPDSCSTQGTCDDAKHTCTAGAAAPDGTSCGDGGTGQVCHSGGCVSASCGDGVVEPPEQCDFGAGNGIGTVCETDCTFSCTIPNDCITPDTCAGTNTCTAFTSSGSGGDGGSPGQKCVVGSPPDGGACLNGGTCQSNHLCASPSCGNGTLESGEQCDWGTAMNVHGSGCEPDCTFSCSTSPLAANACPSPDPCSVAPQSCEAVAGPGSSGGGQKCTAAPILTACAPCGSAGGVCVNGACKPGSCGDGCVVAPETCDPPHAGTCDPSCQLIVCGDGKVTGNEQCDDHNTRNLDGCDQNCNFEQIQRTTSLQYETATTTSTFCPANKLGAEVLQYGLAAIQPMTDTDVASGATSVIFKFMGSGGLPADLSGTSGPVTLGSLSGLPQLGDAAAYSGTSDLDWWYTVDPTTVDVNRNPVSTISGTYANKTLTAGPADLAIKVNLSGSPAALQMWNAMIKVAVGAPSAPTASTGGPPGHLASEHLLGSLTSFENGGVGGSGPTGELCGNITALSLSKVAIPAILGPGGGFACSSGTTASPGTPYPSTSSLLDVIIGGCVSGTSSIILPYAPDQRLMSNTFTAMGGGATNPPYVLSASNSSTHAVDTCVDSSSTPKKMVLSTCLSGMGYSSAFTFQTDRVIIKP
ncbi:MAG: DUF4215 domain-containing protein [Polyangiaceae bacterium]